MQTFLNTLHILVCLMLIGVVLLQRGKGADLGASLGGGGANTIFGGRGAGNFLSRMTTAAAIVFMGTSLSLSYLGYQASDERLFDGDAPIELPGGSAAPNADGASGESEGGGLQEIPGAATEIQDAAASGLAEIQDAASNAAESAGAALGSVQDAIADGVAETINEGTSALGDAAESGAAALENAADSSARPGSPE